jgi:glycosyltransferase involved in cell wall biosynthesis
MANRLAARGWKVIIWSVNESSTLTSWFKLDERVEWFSFFQTGTISDYDNLAYVLARQSGVKIATFWRTAIPVAAASKSGEGYYLIQDVETSYVSSAMMRNVVMKTYELGLRHFTTSRWVEKQLDADYVGIGVDTNFYRRIGVRRNKLMILGCARQIGLKGWDTLNWVNRILTAKGLPMTWFGAQPRCRVFVPPLQYFTGMDDEGVLQLYNQASVFVSTSRHEGFNLMALEAMACGVPVVKTPDDGSEEYVDDGGNCLIGNDGAEVADWVMQVMSSNKLSSNLVSNGLITSSRYNWDDVIGRLEQVIG